MSIMIDATNQSLGRVATRVAHCLRGKHRPTFAPNIVSQDIIEVTNIGKIKLSGRKSDQKKYISHSGYIGHLKVLKYSQVGPKQALERAVWRMLPKNRLRKQMMKKLTIL